MSMKSRWVYQFKIMLKGIRPPIWRRILVPETYTFWDLHVAIQDAMGWLDSHLHMFDKVNPETGVQEERQEGHLRLKEAPTKVLIEHLK